MTRAGTLIRHVRPNAIPFEGSCLGSGGPGMASTPAQFTQPVDGDPIIAMLRERREALGLLQRDVATAAGCHTQHYGHIERGVTSPQLRTLRGILAALALDLAVQTAGRQGTEKQRASYTVRLEAELAEMRSKLAGGEGWRIVAEQRKQIERLTAKADQLHARAVAAEETVSEVREQNRELRKDVTRLTESRNRVRDEARQVSAIQAELDQAQAGLRRALAALDALARQPVLTHDLIDRARSAIAGRVG